MDLSTVANVATAIALFTGLVFGMLEVRHARREREERAAFEILHLMLTPEWMHSMMLVERIPDGVAPADLEKVDATLRAVESVGITLEAIGYAVFARIVPLRIASDVMGGTIRIAWRKLQGYVAYDRELIGSQKSWEWFQWLAERLQEHPGSTNLGLGAHEAHRNWRP